MNTTISSAFVKAIDQMSDEELKAIGLKRRKEENPKTKIDSTSFIKVVQQMSDEELNELGLEKTFQTPKTSENLEATISKLLHKIGIPAHIRGYQYVRTAISLCVKEPQILERVTKELYPTVAKIHNSTTSRVERAIRHSIEVAWDRGDFGVHEAIFENTISPGFGKPTNSEFIAMIADHIRIGMIKE